MMPPTRRKAVLFEAGEIPQIVFAPSPGEVLRPWAAARTAELHAMLATRGAILFRGFGPIDTTELELLVREIAGEPLDYMHRSTPRKRVSGRIFTSTEYPATETIPLHNELSYTRERVQTLFFYCVSVATTGGETPLCDSRRVLQRIDPAIRERFARDGVLYVRNYHPRIDLSWQDVFQTADRTEVDDYCRRSGIVTEWHPSGRLCTRQIAQATLVHPGTGENVWYNQAHLFHISALPGDVQRELRASFRPDELPRNAYYGDGSPIEPQTLDAVRAAYRTEEVVFEWHADDLLVVDNVLIAHGRRPFRGSREIRVGMA
jgi:alpha-ketoglutarate-dependent taurine dioxygenase